ncbi:MAG: hypothetical protein CBB99_06595 [Bacteroidetes bacterium TMED39]|nr:MAG: hypothetical protein CBB99_06595 [Bacteroidetes bacterium TMED39]
MNGNKNIATFLVSCLVLIVFSNSKTAVSFNHSNNQLDKKKIRVAFILPFCISQKNPTEKLLWEVSSSYYSGAKLALQQNVFDNTEIEVFTYDNEHNHEITAQIVELPELSTMDIIFGPVGQKHYQILSSFSNKHSIPLISPFSEINGSLENPLLISIVGSKKTKVNHVVDLFREFFTGKSVVVIDDESSQNQAFISILRESLENNKIEYEWIKFSNIHSSNSTLQTVDNGLVFIPSNNRNVVSVSLGKLVEAGGNFTVLGMNKWSNWIGNEYAFWEKLNLHLLESNFTQPLDAQTRNIMHSYRQLNRMDMDKYAWAGYDQTKFFISASISLGSTFPFFIENQKFFLNSSCLEFIGVNNRLENKLWRVLQYHENQLIVLPE